MQEERYLGKLDDILYYENKIINCLSIYFHWEEVDGQSIKYNQFADRNLSKLNVAQGIVFYTLICSISFTSLRLLLYKLIIKTLN